jgi:ice-binding like protein
MFSRKSCGLAAVTVLLFAASFSARANILTSTPDMGDLLRWGAFSLGGGITTDDTDSLVGTTDIYGDVGVAGNGNITMTGNATIHGDLYWRTNGTLIQNGNSQVTGTKHHHAFGDAQLDNGVIEANNASNTAASFASSLAYAGITSITSSMTLVAQNDRPGNSTVLNLTDFILGDHETLTLVGDGTGASNFILNISRTFMMGAQSQIILQNGVSWDDVLFNVRNKGTLVTMDAQSYFRGILMANKRTLKMDGGATIEGEAIVDQLNMKGGSQIIHPPVTSP